MKTRLLVAALVMAAVFTAAVPAMASEGIDLNASLLDDISAGYTDEEAESILGITSLGDVSASDLLNSIQASSVSGGVLSLSECLNAFVGTNYSFDEVYELTSLGIALNNVDIGLLNASYDNAVSSMADTYNTLDLSGNSVSCAQLFTEKYGDLLDSLSISYATIPSGFDTSAMLQSASSQLSSLYSSATNSGSFASVKNSISIADIFERAAAGPTTYDLKFSEEATELYNGIKSENDTTAQNGYTQSFGYSQYEENAAYIAASDALTARNNVIENYDKILVVGDNGDIGYSEDYFGIFSNSDEVNQGETEEAADVIAEEVANNITDASMSTFSSMYEGSDPDNGVIAVFRMTDDEGNQIYDEFEGKAMFYDFIDSSDNREFLSNGNKQAFSEINNAEFNIVDGGDGIEYFVASNESYAEETVLHIVNTEE